MADHASNAVGVVTLVDRRMHKSEIVTIAGDGYRLREAEERRASARTCGRAHPGEGVLLP